MRYFILAIFLVSFSGHSQTISKQVMGPSGATFENGNNKLSYTAGELAVGAMTSEDGNIQLGNGYYPSLDLSTLNIESPELKLQLKVYPNPTKALVFITHPNSNSFGIFISDLTGKVLLQKQVGKQEPINIERYPPGTYLINVTTEDKKTNSYKIIKQ
jgi:hypothetical protein